MDVQPPRGQMNNGQVLLGETDTLATGRLPFGQAVLNLFHHYFDAFIDPETELFAAAKRQGSWGLILFQLVGAFLLLFIIDLIFQLLTQAVHNLPLNPAIPAMLSNDLIKFALAVAGFFAVQGGQFLVAKSFRGAGSFREQCSAALVLIVPWGIVISIGWLVAPSINAVFIGYVLLLQIVAVRAVHAMSNGRAIITVFVPSIVIAAIILLIVFLGITASLPLH